MSLRLEKGGYGVVCDVGEREFGEDWRNGEVCVAGGASSSPTKNPIDSSNVKPCKNTRTLTLRKAENAVQLMQGSRKRLHINKRVLQYCFTGNEISGKIA